MTEPRPQSRWRIGILQRPSPAYASDKRISTEAWRQTHTFLICNANFGETHTLLWLGATLNCPPCMCRTVLRRGTRRSQKVQVSRPTWLAWHALFWGPPLSYGRVVRLCSSDIHVVAVLGRALAPLCLSHSLVTTQARGPHTRHVLHHSPEDPTPPNFREHGPELYSPKVVCDLAGCPRTHPDAAARTAHGPLRDTRRGRSPPTTR